MAKLKRKKDRIIRRLQCYIVISSFSFDWSDSNVDPPPAAEAYSRAPNRKGKRPTRKC